MNSSLSIFFSQTVAQMAIYMPRVLAAIAVLLIGIVVAKALKNLLVKVLETLRVSRMIQNTPVEMFLKNADVTSKIEVFLGRIFYWILILVVLHTTVSMLGLEPVSQVLNQLLTYLPDVFSAVMVLFVGVLLAGLTEGIIKGAIKSIDGKSARLLGKISSYMVITISILAAISELGIASEFIYILFIGFVTTLTLGIGLALGLGGKDLVGRILDEWYTKLKADVKD